MSETSRARTRIDGLDAIRGLAIGFVLVRHAFPEEFGGAGIVGVVIFFALSGYLISGLIVSDIDRFGTVRWGRFYAHRAFRLLPALLAMLAIVGTLKLVFGEPDQRGDVVRSVVYGALYVADLPFAFGAVPGLGHLWTLAVEEQFYLIWPLALVLVLRLRWSVVWFAVGVTVFIVALSTLSVAAVDDPNMRYMLPTSWAAAMSIGAIARFQRPALLEFSARHRRGLLWASLTALGLLALVPNAKLLDLTYVIGASVVAVCTVGLIAVAEHSPTLTSRPGRAMVWMGTVSYAAYLWNYPIAVTAKALGIEDDVAHAIVMFLTIPASLFVAWLSWISVEAWGRRWRRRFDARSEERALLAT